MTLYFPKIPSSRHLPNDRCLAFEKLDGTNLHWDWDRDFGWHTFGTRRDAFAVNELGITEFQTKHAHLQPSPTIFQANWAEGLDTLFRSHPNYVEIPAFRVFFEFFGPNSFAGLHRESDSHELRLLDVQLDLENHMKPWDFVKDFGHLNTAKVVYEGRLTGKFAEDVRQGKYPVDEGVICKGIHREIGFWMVKIKTNRYLERLKQAFADRWEDYWE